MQQYRQKVRGQSYGIGSLSFPFLSTVTWVPWIEPRSQSLCGRCLPAQPSHWPTILSVPSIWVSGVHSYWLCMCAIATVQRAPELAESKYISKQASNRINKEMKESILKVWDLLLLKDFFKKIIAQSKVYKGIFVWHEVCWHTRFWFWSHGL